MGSYFGKPMEIETTPAKVEKKKSKPEPGVPPFISKMEVQMEFDEIYNRSNEILKTLVKNPCSELEERISASLKSNPLRLDNFSDDSMDSFKSCVDEQTKTDIQENTGAAAVADKQLEKGQKGLRSVPPSHM